MNLKREHLKVNLDSKIREYTPKKAELTVAEKTVAGLECEVGAILKNLETLSSKEVVVVSIREVALARENLAKLMPVLQEKRKDALEKAAACKNLEVSIEKIRAQIGQQQENALILDFPGIV